MLNKGDIVTIRDSSWTRSVVNGELKHEDLARDGERDKEYVVIETDCRFPLTDLYQPADYHNDTVIQTIYSRKVVFVHHRFLAPVPTGHDIIIDGKIIRISHESFLNLREQLL